MEFEGEFCPGADVRKLSGSASILYSRVLVVEGEGCLGHTAKLGIPVSRL